MMEHAGTLSPRVMGVNLKDYFGIGRDGRGPIEG